MRSNMLLKILAPIAFVSVAACSDSSSPNSRPVSLSFSSQAAAAASSQDQQPAYDITVTIGANTVVITKAQVVIRKLQLEQSSTTACPDDEVERAECKELKLGPILVDLPLTATASTQVTATVPEGTYKKIQFKIHKPTSTPADAAFVAVNPNFANTSIRVEGTYNGSPFVYTSSMTENIELTFEPPVVINADNRNVTVQADMSGWFKVNGAVINPTTANSGGANETAVRNNIRASLRAFEDDDKNGR